MRIRVSSNPPWFAAAFHPFHFSEAVRRRSRCGSVRGNPVLSSHFSPGFAPHVGQRTASASFWVTFMPTTCTVTRPENGQFLPSFNLSKGHDLYRGLLDNCGSSGAVHFR